MVQESAFREPATEPFLGAGLLPGFLAPALPRAPQFAGEGFLVLVAHATVCEEGRQHVHLRPVSRGGLAYFLRRLEAFALPLEATAHDPRQDAGEFPPQLFGELSVLLRRRYGHGP